MVKGFLDTYFGGFHQVIFGTQLRPAVMKLDPPKCNFADIGTSNPQNRAHIKKIMPKNSQKVYNKFRGLMPGFGIYHIQGGPQKKPQMKCTAKKTLKI